MKGCPVYRYFFSFVNGDNGVWGGRGGCRKGRRGREGEGEGMKGWRRGGGEAERKGNQRAESRVLE